MAPCRSSSAVHRLVHRDQKLFDTLTNIERRSGQEEAFPLLSNIYGFTVGMMEGVWRGAQQVLIPKYDVEMLLGAIRDYRPTYFPAVPTIYISLLNHPRAKEYGLGKIHNFNSGSAPLPVEVIEQFERLSAPRGAARAAFANSDWIEKDDLRDRECGEEGASIGVGLR